MGWRDLPADRPVDDGTARTVTADAALSQARAHSRRGVLEVLKVAHFGLNAAHFLLLTYPRLAV